MKGIIIDLKLEKVRKKLRLFNDTGYIDEVLLGQDIACVGKEYHQIIYHLDERMKIQRHHNRALDHLRVDDEYSMLINNLHSHHHDFMFPTILSQYRKGINPILAIHQSHQQACLTHIRTHIDQWIIDLVHEHSNALIHALSSDITNIEYFLEDLKENRFGENREFSPQIHLLLKRLKTARDDFTITCPSPS